MNIILAKNLKMVVGKWTEIEKDVYRINIGYVVVTLVSVNREYYFSTTHTPFELEKLDTMHFLQAKCDAISKTLEWFEHHIPLLKKVQRYE